MKCFLLVLSVLFLSCETNQFIGVPDGFHRISELMYNISRRIAVQDTNFVDIKDTLLLEVYISDSSDNIFITESFTMGSHNYDGSTNTYELKKSSDSVFRAEKSILYTRSLSRNGFGVPSIENSTSFPPEGMYYIPDSIPYAGYFDHFLVHDPGPTAVDGCCGYVFIYDNSGTIKYKLEYGGFTGEQTLIELNKNHDSNRTARE